MQIYPISVSDSIETNAYFYIDESTNHGFLIDPAAEPEKLLQIIKDNNWIIEKMLITHGHFDHIGAVQNLHNELNIPYYIHENGKEYLTNPTFNLSAYFGNSITLNDAQYLKENDTITLDGNPQTKLKVIHTPGHTQDSVLFYDKQNHLAFVGDTIFKSSIGRTDFPGGNHQQLKESIQNKVFALPDKTTLYSGHSELTTIEAEKKNFHFFF